MLTGFRLAADTEIVMTPNKTLANPCSFPLPTFSLQEAKSPLCSYGQDVPIA
jgi:hypothetical protein